MVRQQFFFYKRMGKQTNDFDSAYIFTLLTEMELKLYICSSLFKLRGIGGADLKKDMQLNKNPRVQSVSTTWLAHKRKRLRIYAQFHDIDSSLTLEESKGGGE
jgi:hypothetical protein